MKQSSLSYPILESRFSRHFTAATRHSAAADKLWTEIQRRKGTWSIESYIACLSEKQRTFVLALWNAPNRRMSISDLASKVWNETEDPNKQVKPETIRNFVWRLENAIEANGLALFIDDIKRDNGDLYGYEIKEKWQIE